MNQIFFIIDKQSPENNLRALPMFSYWDAPFLLLFIVHFPTIKLFNAMYHFFKLTIDFSPQKYYYSLYSPLRIFIRNCNWRNQL